MEQKSQQMIQLLFSTLVGLVVGVISGIIFRPPAIGFVLGMIVGLRMTPLTSWGVAARDGAIMGAIMGPAIVAAVVWWGRFETATALSVLTAFTALWGGFFGAITGLALRKVFQMRKEKKA